MYIDDPAFRKPKNLNSYIWRYMNFTKFVSILSRKELFFPRADKLGDPFEGSFSRQNLIKRPEYYKGAFADNELAEKLKDLSEFHKLLLSYTFINSWCLNDHESAAMWNLYVQNAEGIAIRSTFERLCNSFAYSKKEIRIGKVQYSDYEKDWIPEDNSLEPFLHKRRSFEYENEIRAIFHDFPSEGEEFKLSQILFDRNGEHIPVDLSVLIENIYVSPASSDWFIELVQSIITTYKMDFEVKRSGLEDDPVY